MNRRLLFLNGLAILAVVCNHAANWGTIALFWWTDRYLQVPLAVQDQIGTLPYYGLLIVKKLAVFSVPAFLFVSGFFITYAARGTQSTLGWKVVRARIIGLLIPYLIWSVANFVGDALQGIIRTPLEYLQRLALGQANSGYFYVPLLCQLYLLSPFLILMAKANWRRLLFVSIFVQLGVVALEYLAFFGKLFGWESPGLELRRAMPTVFFVRVILFFVLGIICGFYYEQLKHWLARLKWALLAIVIASATLAVFESDVVFRLTAMQFDSTPLTIPSSIYVVAFILCFLAFDKTSVPFPKLTTELGKRSYGIYLLHPTVVEFFARAVQAFLPRMLACHALFGSVLTFLAIGGPMLLMHAVARSSARRSYRYLFG